METKQIQDIRQLRKNTGLNQKDFWSAVGCTQSGGSRMNSQKYYAIDLFSGCGGATEGLKRAGFEVLASVEIDEKAKKIYNANHPEVCLFGSDIRNVDPASMIHDLGLNVGELDLLIGCPPCQGFSSIRRKNKQVVDDSRNDLIDDFGRFVKEILPKLIMMENVPGLVKFNKFHSFLLLLKKLGYHTSYDIVNASDYSVPQRRKRLVLLASKKEEINISNIRGESKYINVKEAIGYLPKAGSSGDPVHDLPEMRSKKIQKLISLIPKNGGSRKSLPSNMQLNCHMKTEGFLDVYGRMSWDELAPTITGGCLSPSKGRFLHPEEDRAITLREASILQGFPSNYLFDVSCGKGALGCMIGNAIPPPIVEHHAKILIQHLKSK